MMSGDDTWEDAADPLYGRRLNSLVYILTVIGQSMPDCTDSSDVALAEPCRSLLAGLFCLQEHALGKKIKKRV